MPENQLNIIKIEEDNQNSKKKNPAASLRMREKEMQAKFERLWLLDPKQFDPLRNCVEKERLERTWDLFNAFISAKNKKIADIGCGEGVFSRILRDAGAQVTAVDIAENALKLARQYDCTNMEIRRETMPTTSLEDQNYDVVICTDVIAFLSPLDFRLFFAELARLVKSDGKIVCSTPIDIYSEGAVRRFVELAQTEFDLEASLPSHHALYIRLKHLFGIPNVYIESWKDPEYKNKEMNMRSSFGKIWLKFNSTFLFWFWWIVNLFVFPFNYLLTKNRFVLLGLEKLCQFFSSDEGISHLIIIGKKRPMVQEDPEHVPVSRPKKREIWE